jgi:RHS repeat-associated protein
MKNIFVQAHLQIALLSSLSVCAFAQTGYHQDYARLINAGDVVKPLGEDMFGEQINFYSGKSEFHNVDISLQGNDSLPMSVSRTYRVENRHVVSAKSGAFGDWDFDVPHIEGIFPKGAVWTKPDRCTNFGTPDVTALEQSWDDASVITSSAGWSAVNGVTGEVYIVSSAQPLIDPALLITGAAGTTQIVADQTTEAGIASLSGIVELQSPFVDNTVALRGSSTKRAAFLLLKVNTTGRIGVPVSYKVRDLDTSTTNNAIQRVALQYRVGSSGDFTNIPEGYLSDATNTGATTLVSSVTVTLPVAANNKPEVQIRIITTESARFGAAGTANEWVGIDDIAVGAPTFGSSSGKQTEAAPTYGFAAQEYGYGFRLIVPGKTDSILLKKLSGSSVFPGDVDIVNNEYWLVDCLSNQVAAPLTGDAFKAFSPDGMTYTFSYLIERPFPSLVRPVGTVAFAEPSEKANATNAAAPQTLERVEARMMVTRVEDRFGNWVNYEYAAADPVAVTRGLSRMSSSDGRQLNFSYYDGKIQSINDGTRIWTYSYNQGGLTAVNLPDGSRWAIDFASLSAATYTYATSASCTTFPQPTGPSSVSASITHPSNARATFVFQPFRHALSGSPATCLTAGGMQFARLNPNEYDTLTPFSKAVNGVVSSDNRNWSFIWSAGASTKTTKVIGPQGIDEIEYTFGNRYGVDEGLLLNKNIIGGGGSESNAYQYQGATAGPYPARFGISYQTRGDIRYTESIQPVRTISTNRYGASFLQTMGSFNIYGNAEQLTRSGSASATSTYTFQNKTTTFGWILQALKSISTAGKAELDQTLNNDLQPTSIYRFGKLDTGISYFANGLANTVSDGLGQTTSYSNYFRGVPQNISYPGGATESATVGSFGQVLSTRDELSNTTSYGYDALGRITSIAPNEGASTSMSYSKSGAWQQSRSFGGRSTTTVYNGYWQPTSINDGGRIVNMDYDARGQMSFQSYPNSAAGTSYTHNVFGELTNATSSSELGNLGTNYGYTGYSANITDPRQHTTTVSYQMFAPSMRESPTGISGQEGLSVNIPRDAWGKPSSITRNGVTRGYSYDSFERLIGMTDPETGSTSLSLDSANNIKTRTVGGLTTGYNYNARNWLTYIDYAGAGDDVNIDYYSDGTVNFRENSQSKITYGYNNRRLVTAETHQLKPSLGSYQFSYGYDSLGSMSSMTYPDNTSVAYNPNVFGEAGSAGSFASNVGRFTNGAISSFNYGNGRSRSVSLNARFLPASIGDSGVYSVSYNYDANANPTIVNSTGQSLSLGYDNLDRLTTVGGATAFSYDIHDNLKSTAFAGVQTAVNYNGQLISSVVRGGVTQTVSYDTRGNIIRRGDINFSFNEADQITSIINKNGFPNNPSFWSIAQHGYDPTGHRVISQSGCTSTHNLYGANGKLLWQVYDVPVAFTTAPIAKIAARAKSCVTSPKNRKYIYLDEQVISEVETNADNSTKTIYRHNDALGSARATTDAAGTQITGVNYGPYGEPIPGTQVRGTGFTGHQMDDNDITYMGARYYDQTMGRFLSIDPVGVNSNAGDNWNRYAYAGNNPYKFVDPDGEASKVAWLVRFTAKGFERVGRLTKEAAVRARRQGKNVEARAQQVAKQIEEAAARGNKGDLMRHSGRKRHELGEKGSGILGRPHYQTDGVTGHTFWSVSAGVLSVVADTIEDYDPTTFVTDPIEEAVVDSATKDNMSKLIGVSVSDINKAQNDLKRQLVSDGIVDDNNEEKTDEE